MSSRGEAWETYFTTTRRLSDRIERELKSERGISLPEYNVLLQLSRAGGTGARPSALSREVVFSPSRLTHTLHRLRDRGLVQRSACDTDARGGVVTLTEAGAAEFEAAAQVHRAAVRRLVLDSLEPGDTEALGRVFGRIARRLDEEDARRR
jgi:DNA-binding MarR family transcriptional regulator